MDSSARTRSSGSDSSEPCASCLWRPSGSFAVIEILIELVVSCQDLGYAWARKDQFCWVREYLPGCRGSREREASPGEFERGTIMAAGDLFTLAGRVALVTGASTGLGARFA